MPSSDRCRRPAHKAPSRVSRGGTSIRSRRAIARAETVHDQDAVEIVPNRDRDLVAFIDAKQWRRHGQRLVDFAEGLDRQRRIRSTLGLPLPRSRAKPTVTVSRSRVPATWRLSLGLTISGDGSGTEAIAGDAIANSRTDRTRATRRR